MKQSLEVDLGRSGLRILQQITYAAAKPGGGRPNLEQVYLDARGSVLRAWATDSFRLVIRTVAHLPAPVVSPIWEGVGVAALRQTLAAAKAVGASTIRLGRSGLSVPDHCLVPFTVDRVEAPYMAKVLVDVLERRIGRPDKPPERYLLTGYLLAGTLKAMGADQQSCRSPIELDDLGWAALLGTQDGDSMAVLMKVRPS